MLTATALADLLTTEKIREEELEEAREIQWAMLPAQMLRTSDVMVSHKFQPVTEVGGDFLDYFRLPDGTVGLYVGDVSGKGLPAALYAALAVGTLRGTHKTGQKPSGVLHTLNERLCLRGVPRRHSALQYALFNPESAEMLIASAGMPGPVLIRDGRCESLLLPGMPPGLFPNTSYDDFTLKLQRGDSLLFCTDGVMDARNGQDQEFGLDGLLEVCSHYTSTPLELLEQVFAAVGDFMKGARQWDDMTAAVFHYPWP